MANRNKFFIVGVFVTVVLGTILYKQMVNDWVIQTKNVSIPNENGNKLVRVSEGELGTNLSDEKKLVGAVHNIFIGRVIRQSGDARRFSEPETQFEVRVLYNIKGNLKESVTIDQIGMGYINGIYFTRSGGDETLRSDMPNGPKPGDGLLKIGAAYIFATRFSTQNNWYAISAPPYDSTLLTEDGNLNDEQLTRLAKNNERLRALQEAYPREIISEPDMRLNTSWNSYSSRRFDANGEVIDDTVELRKQLEAANAAIAPAPSESVPPSPTPEASPSEESIPYT